MQRIISYEIRQLGFKPKTKTVYKTVKLLSLDNGKGLILWHKGKGQRQKTLIADIDNLMTLYLKQNTKRIFC
jgi:hypothetical protein